MRTEKDILKIIRIYCPENGESHTKKEKFYNLTKYDYIITFITQKHPTRRITDMRRLIELLDRLSNNNRLNILDDELLLFSSFVTNYFEEQINLLETLVDSEWIYNNNCLTYYTGFLAMFNIKDKLKVSLMGKSHPLLKKLNEIYDVYEGYLNQRSYFKISVIELIYAYFYLHINEYNGDCEVFRELCNDFLENFDLYQEEFNLNNIPVTSEHLRSINWYESNEILFFDSWINRNIKNNKVKKIGEKK